jgi:hypothetical protein
VSSVVPDDAVGVRVLDDEGGVVTEQPLTEVLD